VRPGYSSGASSCDEDEFVNDDLLHKVPSKSHILNLSTLKQDLPDDYASRVVRIETPFGVPIEDVYTGVHDGPILGSGVSGAVRLVSHQATGWKYAVKTLDIEWMDNVEALRALRNEIFIMCQLDHPNIVRIEEVYESPTSIYIVQELCHGGDLFDRLDEQPDFHYTEPQCAKLVKQMVSAVRYLHSKGIVHRDLKLENFLFSTTEVDSELKMIDFGLSKHFELGNALNDPVGTPYTVAPEVIAGKYDERADVWSLGVITFLLLSGDPPFGGLDGAEPEQLQQCKNMILRAKVEFDPEIWDHVSDAGKAFVLRLLQADPSKRPTAKQVQKDDWIQVMAKKKEGKRLNAKTLQSLVQFKEYTDVQKLLSEVLSFTLLPNQIVELRKEFEELDTDGVGEISLQALKKVLRESAEAGSLGALTETEIEDIFDAIKTRQDEPTIRWHDFVAAGLSQARVDDRNLRLAFDRLDTHRRGYISLEDLQNMLGEYKSEELEGIWKDTLASIKSVDRITFTNFKMLMKGQPDHPKQRRGSVDLSPLPEGKAAESKVGLPEDDTDPRQYRPQRSQSHDHKTGLKWQSSSDETMSPAMTVLQTTQSAALEATTTHLRSSGSMASVDPSPLVANKALYRKHREMRMAVLSASKHFDRKRNDRRAPAGLVMKRGAKPPVELEDKHAREMFEAAARRGGRARRTRNKTVSDVSQMLMASTRSTN